MDWKNHILKTIILPKAIYRFNAIPIKPQWYFPQNWNKKFYNFYGNTKDAKQQNHSEKEMELEGSGSLYYKATVIITVVLAQKKRKISGAG